MPPGDSQVPAIWSDRGRNRSYQARTGSEKLPISLFHPQAPARKRGAVLPSAGDWPTGTDAPPIDRGT
jgi:hypothetical protein